ncbi:MAG: hypothetical protein WAR37_00010 [Candidatus Microsaccharimonas sp.]
MIESEHTPDSPKSDYQSKLDSIPLSKEDVRTPDEKAFADTLNNSPDALKEAIRIYDLNHAEQLQLIFALAPFYMGSRHALSAFGKNVVDVDRYARIIVAMRD